MSWEKDDAWSKKPGPRRARGRARSGKTDRHQPDQSSADAQGSSVWEDSRRKAEKRKKRGRLVWIAAAFVLVLLITVALLPTIAGAIAPGIIASAASDAITGRAEVGSVSLSWMGPQRVERLALYDTDNTKRADLSATAEKGLLALAFAGGNFGTVTLTGSLDASPNDKGEPFTVHTVGPASPTSSPPPAPAQPATLPTNLRATLVLDDLQIQYDRAGNPQDGIRSARLDNLSGTVSLNLAEESLVDLNAVVTRKRTGEATYENAGTLAIKASASGIASDRGELTPRAIALDASVEAQGLDPAIAEVAGPELAELLGGRANLALGDALSLRVTAKGADGSIDTLVHLDSAAATLDAPLRIDAGARTIAATAPITATANTERLSHLVPDRDALLGTGPTPDATATQVTEFPTLSVTIDRLALPLPEAGKPLDLANADLALTASLTRLAARVPVPTAGGSTASKAVTIEPSTITANAGSDADPATLTATFPTTIDGVPAGALTADIMASNWRDSGAIGLRNLEGAVRADQLAIAPFQPLAAAAGVDLVALLGDTADLALEAAPDTTANSDATASRFTLRAAAPHASATGELALESGVLRSVGDPLTIRLDRPQTAAAPFLAASGVRLTDASRLEASLSELHLDLDALATGDMRTTAFRLVTSIDRVTAEVPQGSQSTTQASVRNLTANLRSPDLATGARLTLQSDIDLGGSSNSQNANEPGGNATVDLTLSGLLTDEGSVATTLPVIRGSAALNAIPTPALAAFIPAPQLDLPTDLGPTLTTVLLLEPAPSDAGGRTNATIRISSTNLNGEGHFTVAADRITAPGRSLTLQLNAVGPLANRLGDAAGISTTTGGRILVTLTDLDLPLTPPSTPTNTPTNTGPAPYAGTLTLSLDRLDLVGPQGPAGSLRNLESVVTLTPDADPTVTLKGTLGAQYAGAIRTGTLEGDFTVRNAFSPTAPDGSLALAPVGRLALADIPITFARLSDLTFPAPTPESASVSASASPTTTLFQALADAVGPTASFALTARKPSASDPLTITLDADAGPHTLDASLSATPLPPTAGSGFALASIRADGVVTLNEPTVRTIRAIAAPDAPFELTSSGALTLKAREQGDTLDITATLDPLTLAGTAPRRETPTNESAPPPLPPITLAGTLGTSVPRALLTGQPGVHAVSLTADLTGADPSNPGAPALKVTASANAGIRQPTGAGASEPPAGPALSGPLTADLRLSSDRTEWIDALANMQGLLTAAVGRRLDLTTTLTADFTDAPAALPANARAEVRVESPHLRTTRPASLALANNTLRLTQPFAAEWTLTTELFDMVAPAKPGKAAQATLARDTTLTLTADRLALPLGENATANPDINLSATAPNLPLRFADNSTYTLTDLRAALATLPGPGTARLSASARTAETPDADAVTLDATVAGLPTPETPFDLAALNITGVAKTDALPMSLIDALANANGQLVTLLGPTLDLDATLKGVPRRWGTVAFRAGTPQSEARYAATVRPHPADPNLLALVADEPATATITHFEFNFTREGAVGRQASGNMLPVFGSLRKVEGTHRPASVTISQLIAPVDGDVARIIMQGTVDPGVVQYEFDRGLEALLKAANQRTISNAGERLAPFQIAMSRGVASFDKLTVPVGEFSLTAKGSFDLERQHEDITLGIPAGAFAGEIIGNLPGATAGLLNENIIVPVRRSGPMGEDNAWKPDFEAVLKQLFSPENILDNVIKGGLKDILGGGGNNPGPGGG